MKRFRCKKRRVPCDGAFVNRGSLNISCSTLIFLMFFNSHLPFTAGQVPGFKSLDCGASEEYTDQYTGIVWVPDDDYITSGEKVDGLPVSFGPNSPKVVAKTTAQLKSLRWFPEKQSKHCYTFNVVVNTTYLVRGSWYYSNRSTTVMGPLYSSIIFQVAIDLTVHREFTLSPEFVDVRFGNEWIVKSRSTTMSVCLIPIQGVAFINALELRPLRNDMYLDKYEVPACLFLKWRYNVGVNWSSDYVRYPDDKYDRYWEPPPWGWAEPFNKFNVRAWEGYDNFENGDWDFPPNAVMSTAWDFRTLQNITLLQRFKWDGGTDEFGMFSFYIQNLNRSDNNPNITRDFDILVDATWNIGEVRNLNSGDPVQKLFQNLTLINKNAVISFNATGSATVGPIVNAFEAYTVESVNVVPTHVDDGSVIESFKNSYLVLKKWAGDPCLPTPYDWIECSKPADDTPPRVVTLSFSNMMLGGSIPKEVSKLTELVTLKLDGNNFTGEIPDLSSLINLKILHLEDNNLNGTIPSSLAIIPKLRVLYLHNNDLCGQVQPETIKSLNELEIFSTTGSCRRVPSPTKPLSEKSSSARVLTIGAATGSVAFLILGTLAALGCYVCMKRRRSQLAMVKPGGGGKGILPQHVGQEEAAEDSPSIQETLRGEDSFREFTYDQIKRMSNNFQDSIGVGGFGDVFLGQLANGKKVAIKRKKGDSQQGPEEFLKEVQALRQLNHKNIVQLEGYCAEDPELILVYEYMSKGTLYDHLHPDGKSDADGNSGRTYPERFRGTLDWSTRLRIVRDAANGLKYLHYDSRMGVVHRDVKSTNVLLDEKMNAKLGDFGLSRFAPDRAKSMISLPKGTPGWLDPEYYQSGRLTFGSDVYSFGVLLLEVITGRAPGGTAAQPDFQSGLVIWARKSIQDGYLRVIVDPKIRFTTHKATITKLSELAMRCTEFQSDNRKNMEEVWDDLTEIMKLHKPLSGV